MIKWEKLYFRLLESKKVLERDRGVERHHIIPKHDKGSDDVSNLVLLPRRYHILAHYIRWRWLKQGGDYLAYRYMISNPIHPLSLPDVKAKFMLRVNSESFKKVQSDKMRKNHDDKTFKENTKKRMVDYHINMTSEEKQEVIKRLTSPEIRKKAMDTKKNNPDYSVTQRDNMIKCHEVRRERDLKMTSEERVLYYNKGSKETHIAWKGIFKLTNGDVTYLYQTREELMKKTGITHKAIKNNLNKGEPITSNRSRWKGYYLYRSKEFIDATIRL